MRFLVDTKADCVLGLQAAKSAVDALGNAYMTMKERLAAADPSLPPFQRQTDSPTPPPPPRLPWEQRGPI